MNDRTWTSSNLDDYRNFKVGWANSANVTFTPPPVLGSVKLSHKELQRLTPAERAEYARYRSKLVSQG